MKFFKVCGSCGKAWHTQDDFLGDPDVVLIGYQANSEKPEDGFYLFNHELSNGKCFTTLADKVGRYLNLCPPGAMDLSPRDAEPCSCGGFCLDPETLRGCNVLCSNAFAREILRAIMDRHNQLLAC